MKRIASRALVATAAAALGGLGCQSEPQRSRPADPPAPAAGASPAAAEASSPTAAPPPAAASPDYADDVAKLCDVVRLSGAERESPDDRRLPIANWLAANLRTAESRQFLVRIQPLDGARKADALDAEARRVGLAGCALAAEWRAPPR